MEPTCMYQHHTRDAMKPFILPQYSSDAPKPFILIICMTNTEYELNNAGGAKVIS